MLERLNNSATYAAFFILIVCLMMLPSITQMGDLFATQGFDPHGHCFQWRPDILRMYSVSDSLIGLSYVAISLLLFYFYTKLRAGIPFPWVFLAFGAFIITCGITHFMDVWTLWNPTYKISAYAKFATALASTGTAIILPPLLPRIQRIIAQAKTAEQRRREIIASNQALQASENRLRTVVSNAPVILTVLDHEGKIEMMDGQALDWLNIDLDNVLNQSVFDILEAATPFLATIRDVLAGHERLTIVDLNNHTLEVRLSPLTNTDGTTSGVIAVANDITERRRAEQELRRAFEQERELNAMKSRFIESMSHEFRTPLAIISSSGQIIQRYADRMTAERRDEHILKIQKQIDHIVKMLDDVLMIDRIEADHLDFQPQNVVIDDMLRKSVDDLREQKPDHPIRYYGDINCSTAQLDAGLVKLIVNNLVNNARKYSPSKSEIMVTLTCTDDYVTITVSDSGIGIPIGDQKRIFERFYRGANISNIPGTGLGLAIVHRAVTLHHGTITFKSQEGEETTFTVTLPKLLDNQV